MKLPTYDEAKLICSNAPDVFFEKKEVIRGYEVSMFNYMLASYSDFESYLDLGSLEMRGLTFVHHDDGVDRHIALHKFFNLNENKRTSEENLNLTVLSAHEKIDGSMIQPILFPNDRVICKTKMGFNNKQALTSQHIIDSDPTLYKWIYELLKSGNQPIFEYVAWDNQIVVQHDDPELILLQIRDKETGVYLNINDIHSPFEKTTTLPNKPLDHWKELALSEKDTEGYILNLGGELVKLKTKWYMNLHHLVGELSIKTIAQSVLEDTIDDVYANLDKSSHKRKEVRKIHDSILHKHHELMESVKELLQEEYESKKEFALAHKDKEVFSIAIKMMNNYDQEKANKMIIDYMKKQCFKETRAKQFLKLNER